MLKPVQLLLKRRLVLRQRPGLLVKRPDRFVNRSNLRRPLLDRLRNRAASGRLLVHLALRPLHVLLQMLDLSLQDGNVCFLLLPLGLHRRDLFAQKV